MNAIRSIFIKNFRTLQSTQILECGNLNAFIGRNNSGKSTALSAIQYMFDHLAVGNISMPWLARRTLDDFTNKNEKLPLQIGVEFQIIPDVIDSLCKSLEEISPSLAVSIDRLRQYETISFILRLFSDEKSRFKYIESISLGSIDYGSDLLFPLGPQLLSTPIEAARGLYEKGTGLAEKEQRVTAYQRLVSADDASLERLTAENDVPKSYYIDRLLGEASPAIRKELSSFVRKARSQQDLRALASEVIATVREEVEVMKSVAIAQHMESFTGAIKSEQTYLSDLMRSHGRISMLHLRERKQPIGQEEAERLLKLKTRRGGPERLAAVQTTVRALLGVSLDAFEAEHTQAPPEMDIDNFLAEANGSGVREALRLILDLELNQPEIVLLEEPEVHLHPGLEYAVHSYLQDKSKSVQIFLTTHSTNFVDILAPQNIYLFSKPTTAATTCERIGEGDAPARLPAELGLRLSTVFMFDKLVFVEGPSDEAVLRQFARKLDIDLAKAGIAFVHMGGIGNFAHYAAENTLELLSRRRVRMWFIVDRDERDEREIKSMVDRLGDRATLLMLPRRDIENFLVDASAISDLIAIKLQHQKSDRVAPSVPEVSEALKLCAENSREEVLRLQLEKILLAPIYLRGGTGSADERLAAAIAALKLRSESAAEVQTRVEGEIAKDWSNYKAVEVAPGAFLLDSVFKTFGCRFKKESGDSAKLAALMEPGAIDVGLATTLRRLATC